jgi:hypothetical protein
MSSDVQETKIERRRLTKSAEDRAIEVVDTTEGSQVTKVERRRKKTGLGATRDLLARYNKYIPEGYVARFEDPRMDQCEFLYDQDWEYAKDEQGGRILVTANRDKDADAHRFVMMIKRKDWYEADQAEEAARSKARLHGQGSLKGEIASQSDFASGIGYREEKI